MKKSEFEFDLNVPIKYESGGTQNEGFKLILKAPSNRNRFQRALLKQQLMIAFQWMESQKPENAQPVEATEQPATKDNKLSDEDVSAVGDALALAIYEIGRASCRERV